MPSLRAFLGRVRHVAALDREVTDLQREVRALRERNERMRTAMRRCSTCDYRLAACGDFLPDQPEPVRDGDSDGGPR